MRITLELNSQGVAVVVGGPSLVDKGTQTDGPEAIGSLPRGLPNIGDSCYMNSLLQLLARTEDHVSILTNSVQPQYAAQHNALIELQAALNAIVRDLRNDIFVSLNSLRDLRRLLHNAGCIPSVYGQHDPTEVLLALLARFGTTDATPMRIAFVQHYTPEHIERRVTEYDHIPLQIGNEGTHLQAFFDSYFAPQVPPTPVYRFRITSEGHEPRVIDGDETLALARVVLNKPDATREECLAPQLAIIKAAYQTAQAEPINVEALTLQSTAVQLETAPQLLHVQINRAGGNPVIPQTLHLNYFSDITPTQTSYTLSHVICRSGSNANGSGGHVWFMKYDNDQWWRYDDSSITSCSDAAIVQGELNRAAYGCFYRRVAS